MRYFKVSGILFLGVLFIFSLCAQEQPSLKDQYFPYWNQKETLFRILPNDTGEIIFLGDSITDGCEWSELFHDLSIKNRGISGDVTQGVLDRLGEVVESNPKKIFLMIGVNDLAAGKTEKEIVSNIKKIIKNIQKKSPATEIYLESILPRGQNDDRVKVIKKTTTSIFAEDD